jgi:pimeloyl-ACP methyl ester carboxylesterase
MTHGWPGSFLEMLEMIPLLTYPVEHGLAANISFDLIVPSLPGFGFSDRPQIEGMNSFRVAEIWVELMRALGYDRFAAQGGDLGASVSTALGLRHSEHLIGVHLNYIPGSYKPYLAPGTEITAAERQFQAEAARWYDENGDYALTLISLFQMAVVPPSTNNSTPFKKLESPEARNSATVATSSD